MSAFAVVTGGGTAGHVLPALAVAEELEERGHAAAALHYVGAQRGIETRLLPQTPYPHTFLDVVGLQRERRGLTRRNLDFLPKLAAATRTARRLLSALHPRVVVSVGGYASLPAVLAARRLRIPIVVISFDRTPGRSSVLTARFAAASAVAFEGSALRRAVVTGAPVRRAIRRVDRDADRDGSRRELGIPVDRFVVAVIGGSQGSAVLNEATARFAADSAGDDHLAIYHIAGERFAGAMSPQHARAGVIHHVVGYESRMDRVYAAADVLLGRGGASTVAEVAVTGTPAILVPWPAAAEDHQTDNVRWLADRGAAIHLPEPRIGELPGILAELRGDPRWVAELGHRAALAGAGNRAGAIAAVIERVALPDRAATRQ